MNRITGTPKQGNGRLKCDIYSLGMNGLERDEGATTTGGRSFAISFVPAGKGRSTRPLGRTFSYKPFA